MIEVILRGSKVVLREKRVEDGWKDYSWRIDEELATKFTYRDYEFGGAWDTVRRADGSMVKP